MVIDLDDDDSIDMMDESMGTPISKTKTITKNYAVRNGNFRKTRLKVILFSSNKYCSRQMSLKLRNHCHLPLSRGKFQLVNCR